ncbi:MULTISPECIES: hypothetical protein [unclassified Microcoleus]|nr:MULTISPECIES: hypothetical protein [unclassified Microcoleus]MCC3507545.1 hypothetical protein [Microcoleus sp. PH2017_19_SFW_U_A]MCC3526445.1 hypothetical protein [Microcoleus sp. PH2017_20_SFW_D_A]MCC3557529.1 hypothetical protein [Microcoleus sp. PH2017_35_SFW_U_B]
MSNQTKIWTGVGQSYVTQDNSIDVDREHPTFAISINTQTIVCLTKLMA